MLLDQDCSVSQIILGRPNLSSGTRLVTLARPGNQDSPNGEPKPTRTQSDLTFTYNGYYEQERVDAIVETSLEPIRRPQNGNLDVRTVSALH